MIKLELLRGSRTDVDPWNEWGLSRVALARFFKRAQTEVGLAGEIDVMLADDATLRRLNREFRGKNKATDVLSFPAPEEFAGGHAGDLAISLDTAQRQAGEYGHTLSDEIRILLLHGLLHLAGMDHETDKGEMAARESQLRERLKLPVGLIGRATEEPKIRPIKTARTKAALKRIKTTQKASKTPRKMTSKTPKRVTA